MKLRLATFPCLILGFAALCWPLIFLSQDGGYAGDETSFHLPAVRQIRAHWPKLDLDHDTLSAISPGYHYLLATLSLLTGTGRTTLRLVNWGVSLGALWLMWRWFPRAARVTAISALLPLAASNFFVKSASWIVTDNAGLIAVVATLTAILFDSRANANWWAGLGAAAATFVRQLHVWTVAPLAWRAWLETRATISSRGMIGCWLPVALPLVVLAILVSHWHGLVPPAWETATHTSAAGSTAAMSYLLTVFFLFGICYWAAFPAGKNRSAVGHRGWVFAGAGAGLLFAVVGPTNFDMSAGRWGGYLWWCAAHLPAPADRSLFFLVFAPLGGALLPVLVARLAAERGRAIAGLWLCAFLAWAATALANRLAFHRYFEPMILVFLILWMALVAGGETSSLRPRLRLLHFATLGQLALTIATAYDPEFGPKLMLG